MAEPASAALAAAGSLSPAFAQSKRGLCVLHTGPVGICPGLDWHLTVEPGGKLVGFVAWDAMKRMARLDGEIAKNAAFDMNAEEVNRKSCREGIGSGRLYYDVNRWIGRRLRQAGVSGSALRGLPVGRRPVSEA